MATIAGTPSCKGSFSSLLAWQFAQGVAVACTIDEPVHVELGRLPPRGKPLSRLIACSMGKTGDKLCGGGKRARCPF
jgi:hypothetical protein